MSNTLFSLWHNKNRRGVLRFNYWRCVMGQPEIREELKHCEAELTTAAKRGDMVGFRRIVEAAGVTWVEYELPEKYRYQGDIQKLRKDLGLGPKFEPDQ